MDWGGKKSLSLIYSYNKLDPSQVPISKLPFDCCSISLLPFESPVCSPDGIIFDIMLNFLTINYQKEYYTVFKTT